MSTQFARTVLRVCVAQMCQSMGWNSVQASALEILTDILERYLQSTANTAHRYSEQSGRCDPGMEDVYMAFRDMGVNILELEDYLHSMDPIPCCKEVPKFPAPRPSLLKFPKENGRELKDRDEYVDDHLPPMYPEIEEDVLQRPPSRSGTPRSAGFDSMDISPSPGDKRPLSATGEMPPAKRQRNLPEEAEPSSYEMTSVVMSDRGFLSPVRAGRLPEARTPQGFRSSTKEQNENLPPKIKVDDDDDHDSPPAVDLNKEKMKSKIFLHAAKAPKSPKSPARPPKSPGRAKSPKGPKRALLMTQEEDKESSPEPEAIESRMDNADSPEDLLVIAEEEGRRQEEEEAREQQLASIDEAIDSAIMNALRKEEEEKDKLWSDVLAAKAEPITVKKTSPPILFTKVPPLPPLVIKSPSPPASPVAMDSPSPVETPSPLKTPPGLSSPEPPQTPAFNSKSIDDSIDAVISKSRDMSDHEINFGKSSPVSVKPKDVYDFDEFEPKVTSPAKAFSAPLSPSPTHLPLEETRPLLEETIGGDELPKIPKITVQTKSAKGKKLKRLKIKSLKSQDKGKKAKDHLLKKLKRKAITSKVKSPGLHLKMKPTDVQSPEYQPTVPVPLMTPEDIKKFEFPSSPSPSPKIPTPQPAPAGKMADETPKKSDEQPPLAPLKIGFSANKFGIIKTKDKSKKNKKKDKEKKKKNRDKDKDREKSKNKSKKKEEKHKAEKTSQDLPAEVKQPSLPKLTLKLGGLTKGSIVASSPVLKSPTTPIALPPAPKDDWLKDDWSPKQESRPEIPKLKIKPMLPPKPVALKSPSPPASPPTPITPPFRFSPPRNFTPPSPVYYSPPPPLTKPPVPPQPTKPVDTPTVKSSPGRPPKKKPYKEPVYHSPPPPLTIPTAPPSSSPEPVYSPPIKASPGRPPKKKASKESTSFDNIHAKVTQPPKKSPSLKVPLPPKKAALPPAKIAPPPPAKVAPPPPLAGSSLASNPVRTVITETVTTYDESGQQIWICPACKKPDDGSPMVGCDGCDDWFHWPCVGIVVEPPDDQEWFCPRCLEKRKKKRKKKHKD